ncbi:Uncharacterised protein [Mycobacterium tuberculosis]|nr:Uncharacterised protein [Mycobacterium tuberculosis]CNV38343.1 Uncharacterised protein [Mycobacterium tuberculosis]
MHTERVCDHRLDDIAMGAGQPQHVVAVLIGQPPVVFADGCHSASLHLRQTLTAGKHRRAGVGLDYPPQRLVDQVTDFSASPFAVVDFGEPVIDERLQAQRLGQRFDGALTPQHWRRRDRPDRQVTNSIDQPGGLLAPLLVEVDAGPAGQHARGVRGGTGMA